MAGVVPPATVHLVVMRGDDVEVRSIDGDAKYMIDAGWWNGHNFIPLAAADPVELPGYRRAERTVYEFISIVR